MIFSWSAVRGIAEEFSTTGFHCMPVIWEPEFQGKQMAPISPNRFYLGEREWPEKNYPIIDKTKYSHSNRNDSMKSGVIRHESSYR